MRLLNSFMQKIKGPYFLFALSICMLLLGCSVSKNYNPDKKYTKERLQGDFNLLRTILEQKHPSLYWYTSKDSMDYYFNAGYNKITDSLTELKFGWEVIAPLLNKIHCGHTSFSLSKNWEKFVRDKRIPSLPLFFKIWNDTMVVTANLNRKDSVLKKGMLVTSINGIKTKEIIKTIFSYLPQDGYEDNVNYIRVSANFPYFHRNVFGIYKNYSVQYIDSLGTERKTFVPLFGLSEDTLKKLKILPSVKQKHLSRKEKFESFRSIQTHDSTAVMTINTFAGGKQLKSFFRQSFRSIKKNKIKNLVIDIRANGGGDISNYVLLTKYIRSTSFKVADTATSIAKNFAPFTKYIKSGFINNLGLLFLSKKYSDGRYHF